MVRGYRLGTMRSSKEEPDTGVRRNQYIHHTLQKKLQYVVAGRYNRGVFLPVAFQSIRPLWHDRLDQIVFGHQVWDQGYPRFLAIMQTPE